ncbi:ROK family protein [Timonella sp. A28]|uniref:ROK family transcriptional regulator n=1 Tax=Timonella sp. A28 TaxID=3442640 RepID=UPI003EC07055
MDAPTHVSPRTRSASIILDAIRAAGTISRSGLTTVTGLTAATISTVVRKLITADLVTEIGRAESTGGKPRVLLQLNAEARYAIGIHLDHAAVTYVLVNLVGTPIANMKRAGALATPPHDVVVRISDEVTEFVKEAGIPFSKVLGLGLVSPGPLTSAAGMQLTPPFMKSWEDFPLDTELAHATSLPVFLENDATAAAIGEYWSGGTDHEGDFASLYLGTGLGAGLLIGGSPFHGASGNAGEIGHTTVSIDGPLCWCGMHGCVEVLAGPAAVVTQARARRENIRDFGLSATENSTSIAHDFALIAAAAQHGNEHAQQLLKDSARYIAAAAHTIANLFDLRMLVLTGPSFAAAGDIYLPAITHVLNESFFARSRHHVDVRLSQTAETAAAIGAAALVLQNEFVPERSAQLASAAGWSGIENEISTLSTPTHT